MTDLVSIIMPVKNGVPYLEECINSIINQSYKSWELIIINDHSDDKTQSVLDKYSNIDKRITSKINNGAGIINALKTGYTISQGTYITRMDADDIMPPQKIEKLYQAIVNVKTPSLSTGYVKYFSDSGVNNGYANYESWLNKLCDDSNHYQHIYKECVIPSPCWMMRRNHFDDIGGFDSETYPEDYDLCFRMYQNDIKVIPICETLHHWRDHSTRTSRNDDNYADNRFLQLKLEYFHRIETPKRRYITLVGAGKKGKSIAKFLIENEIDFEWATNNPKKIGVNIFGIILTDYDKVDFSPLDTSFIISVANKEEQHEINQRLSNTQASSIYYFC